MEPKLNREQQAAQMELGAPSDKKVASAGASLCVVQTMADHHRDALRVVHEYIKTQPREPAVVPAMLALMAAAQAAHGMCEVASEALADFAVAAGVDGNQVCVEAMRLSGIAEGMTSAEAKARADKHIAEVNAAESLARAAVERARMAPGGASLN